MTFKVPGLIKVPTEMLGLGQVEKDTFLDLFGDDFVKI
jgi:hypothetical protein